MNHGDDCLLCNPEDIVLFYGTCISLSSSSASDFLESLSGGAAAEPWNLCWCNIAVRRNYFKETDYRRNKGIKGVLNVGFVLQTYFQNDKMKTKIGK